MKVPPRRFHQHRRRTKDPHRVFLLSKSWIKRSSKLRLEKRWMKRACMRNGGSFPIALLMIVTWSRHEPGRARQRLTWKNVNDCAPIILRFTIGCAPKQAPRNLRTTSTRTKRSIWRCWHKTAFAPRLLLLLLPRQENGRNRAGLLRRNLNCERQNRLCRNSRRRRDEISSVAIQIWGAHAPSRAVVGASPTTFLD